MIPLRSGNANSLEEQRRVAAANAAASRGAPASRSLNPTPVVVVPTMQGTYSAPLGYRHDSVGDGLRDPLRYAPKSSASLSMVEARGGIGPYAPVAILPGPCVPVYKPSPVQAPDIMYVQPAARPVPKYPNR